MIERIVETFKDKKYILDSGNRVNLVGFRNPKSKVNYFDDALGVLFWNTIKWELKLWPGTTMPGSGSLLKPVNSRGTAILVPGQYVDSYQLGLHKGYRALCQVEPVRVYRDANLDKKWDTEEATIQRGRYGINIHKAGWWSRVVGPYSAGCQVFQRSADFQEFLDICLGAEKKGQKRFTYTLFETTI